MQQNNIHSLKEETDVYEWIDKMWYIPAMEYYSALKRNEILTHAATQMNLEDVMLSEISQSQRTNIVRFQL